MVCFHIVLITIPSYLINCTIFLIHLHYHILLAKNKIKKKFLDIKELCMYGTQNQPSNVKTIKRCYFYSILLSWCLFRK